MNSKVLKNHFFEKKEDLMSVFIFIKQKKFPHVFFSNFKK